MEKYNLVCMDFEGNYVIETTELTIDDCNEFGSKMGMRWFVKPFHFVCNEEMIVVDAFDELYFLLNKQIEDIKQSFLKLTNYFVTLPFRKELSVIDFEACLINEHEIGYYGNIENRDPITGKWNTNED